MRMPPSVTGLAGIEVQPTSSVSAHYVVFERPAATAAGTEKHQKKKSGPAGSSRVGVGRLGVGVGRLAVPGQVERRDEPLSLRS